MGSRFVQVRAEKLLGELRSIGEKVVSAGGSFREGVHAREIVVDLVPKHARAMVRIYTSLASGAAVARGNGEDAVRILVCVEHPEGFRSLEEPRRIFRTAPKASTEAARERLFINRLTVALRTAYGQALHNEPCPRCGRATADRKGKFRGCSGFPDCKGTLPARAARPAETRSA